MDLCRQSRSLLFSMLSRLVIAFLPRSKCLLISWLKSPSAMILEPKKIKSLTVSIVSPSICHGVMGPDAMIFFECWVLSLLFHSPLSLSSRCSLVLFVFCHKGWCHLHIWSYWYFSWQSLFQPGSSARLEEPQAGIKIAGRNINNLR